jgi:hypothetical protein
VQLVYWHDQFGVKCQADASVLMNVMAHTVQLDQLSSPSVIVSAIKMLPGGGAALGSRNTSFIISLYSVPRSYRSWSHLRVSEGDSFRALPTSSQKSPSMFILIVRSFCLHSGFEFFNIRLNAKLVGVEILNISPFLCVL